jgi:hypothetical protein
MCQEYKFSGAQLSHIRRRKVLCEEWTMTIWETGAQLFDDVGVKTSSDFESEPLGLVWFLMYELEHSSDHKAYD